MRRFALALVIVIAAASCGDSEQGPAPPEPGRVQTVCLPEFCVDYPSDWVIEVGENFVRLEHPLGPLASVGKIDMEGVVTNAGDVWPTDPASTMESFWKALDELAEADVDTIEDRGAGIVDSEGELDGQRLWHRLLVVDAPRAWGAEMRAPDARWETHAEIIVASLRLPADG